MLKMVHSIVCAVDKCLNNELTHPGKRFFKFPSDKSLCQKWLENCGRDDLTPQEAVSNKFSHKVCEDHFDIECFPPTTKYRLRKDIEVVPTIFDNDSNNITVQSTEVGDHSYTCSGIDLPCRMIDEDDPAEYFECVLDPRELLVKTDDLPVSYDVDAKPHQQNQYFDSQSIAAVLLKLTPEARVNRVKDLCRLCMDKIGYDFINVFEESKESREIWKMCATVFPLKLNFNICDGIPQHICRKCIQNLTKCYKIVSNFLQADSYLRVVARHSLFVKESSDAEERLLQMQEEERLAQVIPSDALIVPLPVIKSAADAKSDSDTLSAVESDMEFEVMDETHLPISQPEVTIQDTRVDSDGGNISPMEELPDVTWDEEIQPNSDLDETETSQPKLTTDEITYDCGICYERFLSFSALYQHRYKTHGDIKFKCDQCVEIPGFKFRKDYNAHMAEKHKVECNYCKKIFFFKAQLDKHISVKHEKLHKCKFCEKRFTFARSRITHENQYHSSGICWVCGKTVKQIGLHLRSHDKNKSYRCKLCKKIFKDLKTRDFHIKDVHYPEKYSKIVCEECGERFVSEKSLQHHKETKHCELGAVNYTCDKCGGGFRTNIGYMAHQRRLKKTGVCGPSCHKDILSSDPEPVMKRRTKNLYKNKLCDVCGRGFFLKVSMKRHRKLHFLNGDKEILGKLLVEPEYRKCEECDKKFYSKLMLMTHRARVHTKVAKPYECEFCGMKFKIPIRLIVHYRTHTGERPFKCKFCDKSFIERTGAKLHEITHEKDTNFNCPKCQRRFRVESFYKKHVVACNGEVKYVSCWMCEKTFALNRELKVHLLKKHGVGEPPEEREKILPCWVCGKKFVSNKGLKCHLKRSHREQVEEQATMEEVETYVQIPDECGDYVTIDLSGISFITEQE